MQGTFFFNISVFVRYNQLARLSQYHSTHEHLNLNIRDDYSANQTQNTGRKNVAFIKVNSNN